MTFNCVIVDDEELARRLLANHLSQVQDFNLIASCASAIEANEIIKDNHIDLLFLDIEMPVLTGMDFFKNLSKQPKVIFTTAYRDYAVEGFELDAVDYLLKPITFARFFKAVEKFKLLNQQIRSNGVSLDTKNKFLFVRKDRKQVKVFFSDILYIESLKDYIKIYTTSESHVVKHSLHAFYDLLDDRFIQTHRSYLVNANKLSAYTNKDVEIGSIEIPIGDSFKSKVTAYLKRQL